MLGPKVEEQGVAVSLEIDHLFKEKNEILEELIPLSGENYKSIKEYKYSAVPTDRINIDQLDPNSPEYTFNLESYLIKNIDHIDNKVIPELRKISEEIQKDLQNIDYVTNLA